MDELSLAVEIGLMSAILDRCDDAHRPARYAPAHGSRVRTVRGAARHRLGRSSLVSHISFGLLTNKIAPFPCLT
ncbi:hypothetical protein KEC55_08820 [Burkholderia cepacia]|uniref:hypothetical protein n=1 Tax=Burkholderia cepacia TaxID=292 RepID=UPI00249EFC7D|nr:hypothetical protein [Burkholderia cepacia]WGY66969.1 hypothetical protein KEC55_08820 [Burkholderia cepacia]